MHHRHLRVDHTISRQSFQRQCCAWSYYLQYRLHESDIYVGFHLQLCWLCCIHYIIWDLCCVGDADYILGLDIVRNLVILSKYELRMDFCTSSSNLYYTYLFKI